MLLFLAQTIVSCSNSAHTRGAVREPTARVIGTCLSQGGHPFFEQFLEALFSLKIRTLTEKMLQNGPRMKSMGSYVLEKVWK